jgi:hypothetical protein
VELPPLLECHSWVEVALEGLFDVLCQCGRYLSTCGEGVILLAVAVLHAAYCLLLADAPPLRQCLGCSINVLVMRWGLDRLSLCLIASRLLDGCMMWQVVAMLWQVAAMMGAYMMHCLRLLLLDVAVVCCISCQLLLYASLMRQPHRLSVAHRPFCLLIILAGSIRPPLYGVQM